MFTQRLVLTKIASTFTKVITDLEALKAQNKAEIEGHAAAITAAQTAQAELQAEHDAADRLHANVTKLLA